MGGNHGHDHGHSHGLKVPDWRSYKVVDAPELVQLQQALAQKGLKDPWLRYCTFSPCLNEAKKLSLCRNEVWRFQRKEWGTTPQRWKMAAFRGFKWGFLAFLATITIEKGLELVNPPANGHHGSHH